MNSRPQSWTARHFTQANPKGAGQGDVPALLRRIAATLDDLGEVDVQDLVLHTDVTEDGEWHNITVYFTCPEDEDDELAAGDDQSR